MEALEATLRTRSSPGSPHPTATPLTTPTITRNQSQSMAEQESENQLKDTGGTPSIKILLVEGSERHECSLPRR
jgi:hypothetical protein